MSDLAIKVENLSKEYRIGVAKNRHDTLRDALTEGFKSLFRRNGRPSALSPLRSAPSDTFWALKDVSFEVKQGEVVGIIGRNGAGKSTLLKILSRITEPTNGRVEIYGQVGSLLEVGTGFHGELTGRENIYLNGAILGMKKAEIDRKFDEIVAFAEIEKFIDTPVKRYSSGMYVRLAFAVAAHLEPDILIVDEVLAVGDAAFQQKCLGKMHDVASQGRTVLFVSHNMLAMAELCEKAVLLNRGSVVTSGIGEDVIKIYLSDLSQKAASVSIKEPTINKGVVVRRVGIFNYRMDPTSQVEFTLPFSLGIEFVVSKPVPQLSLSVRLVNEYGVNVLTSWIIFQAAYNPGTYVATGQFPPELLMPGCYYVDVGAEHYKVEEYHYALKCLAFDITNTTKAECDAENPPEWGVILLKVPWEVAQQNI